MFFLYSNNKQSERSKKKNPIYNCIKNGKIPRVTLTKKVKDLNIENYKTLMKEVEEDTKNRSSCSWIGKN